MVSWYVVCSRKDSLEAFWDILVFRITAGLAINTYWLPIIIPAGLIGNILSLCVMLQKRNRKTTCAIYFAALALCDSWILVWGLVLWCLLTFNIPIHWGSCALPTYALLSATQCGTLILVIMTYERFIAVRYPLKSCRYFTVRRAKISLLVITLFSHFYNIPHVFITEVVDTKTCASFAVQHVMVSIYSWISIILNALVPFALLLFMNTSIIIAIRDRMDYFENQVSNNLNKTLSESRVSLRDGARMERTDNQLTVMLLCVSFIFILLTLPQYTRYIIYTFIPMDNDPDTFATFVLIYHITNKAFYTNSAINFWLYVASGSKFRQDLMKLCCSKKGITRRASTTVSSTRTKSTDLPLQAVPIAE